jgi:hypothetical protein
MLNVEQLIGVKSIIPVLTLYNTFSFKFNSTTKSMFMIPTVIELGNAGSCSKR